MHRNTSDGAQASLNAEIACHGCDLLVSVDELRNGQRAACPRCGAFLTRLRTDIFERVTAYAFASLVLLVLANAYPFLSFSSSGLESVITLRQTPGALWDNGMPGMAILVGAFIILIPAAVLVMMLALCLPMSRGNYRPWLAPMARGIFLARNWAMVEVFIIGVIVSLVKIAAMATVVLGISFLAYAAFSICFTLAVAGLDRYQCWERIEALQRAAR